MWLDAKNYVFPRAGRALLLSHRVIHQSMWLHRLLFFTSSPFDEQIERPSLVARIYCASVPSCRSELFASFYLFIFLSFLSLCRESAKAHHFSITLFVRRLHEPNLHVLTMPPDRVPIAPDLNLFFPHRARRRTIPIRPAEKQLPFVTFVHVHDVGAVFFHCVRVFRGRAGERAKSPDVYRRQRIHSRAPYNVTCVHIVGSQPTNGM